MVFTFSTLERGGKALRFQPTPPQVLVSGFALLILAGAILLYIPAATAPGNHTSFLTALFTATSAVCVTGLVVVDTGTHWSILGQAIILFLVQVGGLGFMTVATLFFIFIGRRIGFKERILIQESLNQVSVAGIVRIVKQIILFTLIAEGIFAAILTLRWAYELGWEIGAWWGVFHAVSAFNNAGFDLIGDFNSMMPYVNDPVINFSITTLVILGGLGFAVIVELYGYRHERRITLHSKMVLTVTLILVLAAMILIAAVEWNHGMKLLPVSGKIQASYFQAVMPRTAGFNTVDLGKLLPTTQFIIILLMFIGASPGSTGGGIKTTTMALLFLTVRSVARGKEDVEAYRRRIPHWLVYKALSITFLSIALVMVMVMLLTYTEQADFLTTSFEVVSAFSTVGLSLGITPNLSEAGKIIVILTMFIGRLGPLTLTFALTQRKRKAFFRYPEEKILVG